jgi:hypothetical protein
VAGWNANVSVTYDVTDINGSFTVETGGNFGDPASSFYTPWERELVGQTDIEITASATNVVTGQEIEVTVSEFHGICSEPTPTPTMTATSTTTPTVTSTPVDIPSVTPSPTMTPSPTPTPETPHSDIEFQKVKSSGAMNAFLRYISRLPQEVREAIEIDIAGKATELFGNDAIAPEDAPAALLVPEMFQTDPSVTLHWNFLFDGNPVGIVGKGLGIDWDHAYRRNGRSFLDFTLYGREDLPVSNGIWCSEEVYGPMEMAGPKSVCVPSLPGRHNEMYYGGVPWFEYIISFGPGYVPEMEAPDWAKQQFEHMTELVRLQSIFFGMYYDDNDAWYNMRLKEGRYSPWMDMRTPHVWDPDPSKEGDELTSYFSKGYSNLLIEQWTTTYFGLYGKSGIEFAWNPLDPNPFFINADGSLAVPEADYHLYLDSIPDFKIVDGKISHEDGEVINFEIVTAQIICRNGMAGRHLTFVPQDLVSTVGCEGTGVDYAHYFTVEGKADEAKAFALEAWKGLVSYMLRTEVTFKTGDGMTILPDDMDWQITDELTATVSLRRGTELHNNSGAFMHLNDAAGTVLPFAPDQEGWQTLEINFFRQYGQDIYNSWEFNRLIKAARDADVLAREAKLFSDAEQGRIDKCMLDPTACVRPPTTGADGINVNTLLVGLAVLLVVALVGAAFVYRVRRRNA